MPVTMNTHDALRWRYATKKFDPAKKISDAEFAEVLDSLRLAPSSFGLQPWKFVIVENKDIRHHLVQYAWGQTQVTDASHLIVLCSLDKMTPAHVSAYVDDIVKKRGVSHESLKGYENMMLGFISRLSPEAAMQWMKDQVYIALGFLMFETAVRGIDSCPMEGFDAKRFDEVLKLEEKGLRSVVLCPVGYRAKDDHHAIQPKVRFPEEQIFLTI